jgi:hypothetical protein
MAVLVSPHRASGKPPHQAGTGRNTLSLSDFTISGAGLELFLMNIVLSVEQIGACAANVRMFMKEKQ